ncbi:MAG: hypothetical protein ACXVEF_37510 [Polyangiales bacterium]
MSTAEKSEAMVTTRNGLDEVREILVGGQLRDLERKIARLEARFGGEVDDFRKEIGKRLSDLEAYVRGEVEALSSRLDDERNARVEAQAQQAKEARETASTLELKTNRLDEAGSRGLRDLRRQMHEQSKSILDEVARTKNEIVSLLEPHGERDLDRDVAVEGERASLH